MAAEPVQPRKATRSRRGLRWLLGGACLITAFAAGAVLWLNFLGVPRFVQERLWDELRTEDFDVGAARMHLEGISRLVVENLEFQPRITNFLPRLQIKRAEVLLDGSALGRLQLRLNGLKVQDGRLEWLLQRPGKAPELLLVTNLQSELAFRRDNEWQLVQFQGESAGATVKIEASLTNPAALQDWRSSTEVTGLPPEWKEQVADLLELLRNMEFDGRPELSLRISGDAADWKTFQASARLVASGVRSKWGRLDEIELQSSVRPTNSTIENITLGRIRGIDSDQLRLGSAEIRGRALLDIEGTNRSSAEVDVRVASLDSRWLKLEEAEAAISSVQERSNGHYRTKMRAWATPVEVGNWRGTNLMAQTELEHSLPMPSLPVLIGAWLPNTLAEPTPPASTNYLSGGWHIELDQILAPRFAADSLRITGIVAQVASPGEWSDPAPGFWIWLQPYQMSWTASLSNIYSQKVELGSAQADGTWHAPELELKSLSAQLYGGGVAGRGSLNVVTRQALASAEADFDYQKGALLLNEQVQRWLGQFSWEEPPSVEAKLKVQLPGWTSSWAKFDRQVLPSLEIDGRFQGAGSFRGIPAEHAESHFHFKDFVWHLPDLTVTRPEGNARLAYTGNVSNQDFSFQVQSRIDPGALKPLFSEEQQEFFKFVEFPEPPVIEGTATGRWGADERLSANLRIAVTNFLVKGEQYSDLTTMVHYTNLIIECEDLIAHRGSEQVRAPYLRIDVTNETMFVTNVVSNSDPHVAMKLIGEKVYKAIEPYQFATPPSVRISGIVPLRHHTKSDLHFEVAGEDFTYWKFRIPYVVGDIFWKGDYLSFSNVQASFYQGEATWSASFFFDEENDAEFSFAARTVESDLKPLMKDLFEKTNQMEGIFTADLVITSARSNNDRSWDGYGALQLRDGFLWNIPVFGVFSPMLETVSPGLGTSRVSAGSANFNITNTVFHSENMEVRAPAFRLRYDGFVDLDGNLEAEVEAILLRDTWVLGPVFSLALWPVSKAFEAKVSGTVEEPVTRLKYVPRFLLAPFRALNLLKTTPSGENQESESPALKRPE